MRFVSVKSAEQQAVSDDARARELLIRQRTMLVNALRAHLAEFGIVAAQGIHPIRTDGPVVPPEGSTSGPRDARTFC